MSVGFKYLCGPYGTGFCWLAPQTMDRIATTKLYWLSAITADDLAGDQLDLDMIQAPDTASRHDVFGTANFFNFAAWAESIDLILRTGVEHIYAHNLSLAARLIDGVDRAQYEVQDRGDPQRLSSIVFLRPIDGSLADAALHLADARIDVAKRRGMLRFAPHFYNGLDDIDRAIAALNTRG